MRQSKTARKSDFSDFFFFFPAGETQFLCYPNTTGRRRRRRARRACHSPCHASRHSLVTGTPKKNNLIQGYRHPLWVFITQLRNQSRSCDLHLLLGKLYLLLDLQRVCITLLYITEPSSVEKFPYPLVISNHQPRRHLTGDTMHQLAWRIVHARATGGTCV